MWLVVALFAISVAAGCRNADKGASETPGHAAATASLESAPAASATAATSEVTARGTVTAELDVTNRKLIQTAELHLRVDSYDATRKRLEQQLKAAKGYIENAELQHNDGAVSHATLRLRIPQQKLQSFLNSTTEHGEVLHEALRTQDVSDTYFDTEARLKNARKLEARLLELMAAKTDGVKDLLEVEREIARVREQIERMDGQLNRYDKQIAFSTLELQIVTRRTYAAGVPPTIGERVSNAWNASLSGMAAVGRGILLALVALAPWLPPLALLGYLLFRLARRVSRRNKRVAALPAAPAAQG